MPTSARTRDGMARATSSKIHPPMDDPTRTCGPSVSWVMAARASSNQSPMAPSRNAPDD